MRQLPVFATAERAYAFLFHEIGTIFRLSWVALLVSQVVDTFVELKFGQPRQGGAVIWLASLATLMTGCIVAVAIHRIILFNNRRPGLYFYIEFGKAEFLFLLVPILIWILVVAGTIALTMAFRPLISALASVGGANVATAVLMSPALYLIFRLSIVFPDIVVRQRFNLARAWGLTRDNSWRFLAVLLLTDGVIYLVDSAIETVMKIPTKSNSPELALLAIPGVAIYQIFSQMVTVGLGVAALSYSYKFLSGHDAEDILTPQV